MQHAASTAQLQQGRDFVCASLWAQTSDLHHHLAHVPPSEHVLYRVRDAVQPLEVGAAVHPGLQATLAVQLEHAALAARNDLGV